jgi:hypothetical protein
MTRHSSVTTPKARKPHTCESCRRTIHPGEKYIRQFIADGQVAVYVECIHCNTLADLWDLYQWTNCEGYGREDFEEYGRDCAHLDTLRDARWYVQWKRQWRRYDGTLYSIPSLPHEDAA